MRIVLLTALGMVLAAACRTVPPPIDPPPIDPPPHFFDRLDIVATSPIAGAYLEFTVPAGVTVTGVSQLRSGVMARAVSVDDSVRVSWVGADALAGVQVRILFDADGGTVAPPNAVSGLVLASYDGTPLGMDSLSIVPPSDDATESAIPLDVPTVEHGTDGVLLASFADHPLGDLDGDGMLSVRDALVLLERTVDGAWTDFERYHADLTADDATNAVDLAQLLDKLVDPELPARLHVKPTSVSFTQLDPATADDAIVLVGNQGRAPLTGQSWMAPDGVDVAQVGGIAGTSVAYRLTLPADERRGWLPGFFRVEHEAEAVEVRVGSLVFLIAGQSNAVGLGAPLEGWDTPRSDVRMLGNDYRWRDASEPLDDATDQEDSISDDGTFVRYSFATRLGHLLADATGYPVYLIPAAKGSSKVNAWGPMNPWDRTTLFGSANYRAQVSAGLRPNPVTDQPVLAEGGPVSAVVWYQGESDRAAAERLAFISGTNKVMTEFEAQLGVPTIAVQLASFCTSSENTRIHSVSELQRRLETNSGELEARDGFHLVVAFDLPRSDCIHLSAYGQRVLAERIDLAVREHVLGESVDGTGPRITSLSHAADVVTVRTTHELQPGLLNVGLFTVWDVPPEGPVVNEDGGYAHTMIPVVKAARSNSDPNVVILELHRPVTPGNTPYVRYMSQVNPPLGSSSVPSDPSVWEVVAPGTVRAADGGLPLPAFGPLPPFTTP